MAVYTLKSLVLRGVSVLCDGKAVELCLAGTEVTTRTRQCANFPAHT